MLLHSFFHPPAAFLPGQLDDPCPDRPRVFNDLLHKPPPSPPPAPYHPASPVLSSGSPSGSSVDQSPYDYHVQSAADVPALSPSSSAMYDNEGYYRDSAASGSPGSPHHPHPQAHYAASPSPSSVSPPLAPAQYDHPYSAPAHQPAFPSDRFLADPTAPASLNRYSSTASSSVPRSQPAHSASFDRYSYSAPSSMLADRRMSEPTISSAYSIPAPSSYPSSTYSNGSSQQYDSPPMSFRSYNSSHHRVGSSSGSVHDFPGLQLPQPSSQHYPSSGHQQQHWPTPQSDASANAKFDDPSSGGTDDSGFQIPALPSLVSGGGAQMYAHDEPISPLHSTFSGSSTTSGGGGPSPPMPFAEPLADPQRSPKRSPPSPNARTAGQGSGSGSGSGSSGSNKKTYSFIPLPGQVRKRPRRRYDEIERNYRCSWPGCNKAYGTLNHLNAHVVMQGHGQRRTPAEFKELRKQWRKQKKEEAVATATSSALSRAFPPHAPHGISPNVHHPSASYSLPGPPRHRMSLPSLHPEYEASSFRAPASLPSSFPPLGASAYGGMYGGSSSNSYDYLPEDLTGPAMRPLHVPSPTASSYTLPPPPQQHRYSHSQQGHGGGGFTGMGVAPGGGGRLPPDSTLLTPLPGYEPPKEEDEDRYRR